MGSSSLKFESVGDIINLVFRGKGGKSAVDFTGESVTTNINESKVMVATKDKVSIPVLATDEIFGSDGIKIEDFVVLKDGILHHPNVEEKTVYVELGPEQIAGTDPGCIGHEKGALLVKSPGKEYVLQLVNAVFIFKVGDTIYSEGDDDLTINLGDAIISGPCAATDLITAIEDKILMVSPLASFGAPLLVGEDLVLKAITPYVNPGGADGRIYGYITYRTIKVD